MKRLTFLAITARCQNAGIALSKRGTVSSDKLAVWNGDQSLIRVTVSGNYSVHLSQEKLFDQSSNTDNWNETVWHGANGENRPWIKLDLKVRFKSSLRKLKQFFREPLEFQSCI